MTLQAFVEYSLSKLAGNRNHVTLVGGAVIPA